MQYHVFHDVPASASRKDFNLDHVVVGPTGIFVIETKTRRKKPAPPGKDDHVVTFSGNQIIWPFGAEAKSINQAKANVDWLRKWLRTETSKDFSVRAIVAIPGWYVKSEPSVMNGAPGCRLSVLNQKMIVGAVLRAQGAPLHQGQITLISGKLSALCKNVDY